MSSAIVQPIQITYLRSMMGIGKIEFGRRMGVNRVTVHFWETGERNPSKTAVILMQLLASNHHIDIPAPDEIMEVEE